MDACAPHTSLGTQQPSAKLGSATLQEMWFSIAMKHEGKEAHREVFFPHSNGIGLIFWPLSCLFMPQVLCSLFFFPFDFR